RTIYNNFAFEVNMTISQGDCGGITMRSESNSEYLYWFKLCQDGRYSFYKYTTNSDAIIKIDGSTSEARTGTDQSNVIAVVANNGYFDLYVNGQKINSDTDTDYSHFR